MSGNKIFQVLILISILLSSFASPVNARALSSCGSTYIAQWGDSLSTIAERCGTTISALYAANPGISGYLYAGQVLLISGSGYTDTYIVQRGDTFSEIAKRFGVSVNNMWAANPHIWNINRIYPGQFIYVPASSSTTSSWFTIVPVSTEPLVERSYGTAPSGTPSGKIKLINNANAEVYVSLQGTTRDGVKVINEYPVSGTMNVNVPAGWYLYVAWVGGQKFSGQFNLSGDSRQTITFYIHKVVTE